ncbi:MAG: YifB family Mg chelatase-like AAA ATPase [Planctomycetota bacterium]
MISRVHSSVLQGIDALPCEAEVDVSIGGMGEFKLVGLAEAAVKESVSRIQAAIRNSGYRWPGPKVVVSLAPADLRKDSAAFDLPIAIAALVAGGQFTSDHLDEYLVVGELALDGRVRPVRGGLATAMLAARNGWRGVVLPAENAAEAAVVGEVEVIPIRWLSEAVGFFTGEWEVEPTEVDVDRLFETSQQYAMDFADVRGQEGAKRALTIAAGGHHNLLMIGPPGSGKSMLAKRIPSILPPLTLAESLETTRIYSSRGMLDSGQSLVTVRPVRTPHHSSSSAALVGGGAIPQPGEVSLAHHGVLFLDELPEFARPTLEMIRQPLEDKKVTIPRVHATLDFPASIMLVAAMNPCPCGYATDPKRHCKCSPVMVERYMGRVSGPLIDRIDLHVEVPPVPWKQLRGEGEGLSSAQIREQVIAARAVQRQRFGGNGQSGLVANATMSPRQVRQFCQLDDAGEALLRQAMNELGLSARAHDKVLRIARTIADLDREQNIQAHHVAEAVQYRRLDRRI